MRRAISLLVVASLIGIVLWLWVVTMPWWLELLQRDHELSAFKVASTIAYVSDVLVVVLVATAAVLLARAEPSARSAQALAVIAAALVIAQIALPYVLPNPYSDASPTDYTYRTLRVASELFRSGALIAIALTLRRLAPGRIGDAALALALLIAIGIPALVWSWFGPLGFGWGFRINSGARVLLFAIIAIAMRRKVSR